MGYDFESFLSVIRHSGAELQARCPFHDDVNPSFSANLESGLWICHAGCGAGNFDQFLRRIGGHQGDVFRPKPKEQFDGGVLRKAFRKVAVYEYQDRSGVYHLRIIRMEHSSGEKKFVQEHRNEMGRWVPGGATKEVLPFLIHTWRNSTGPIFFVEGEKCAAYLNQLGLHATAIPGGVNGWHSCYKQSFVGKRVVVLPDNDPPGRQFAQEVYEALLKTHINVSVCSLEGLADGEDVVDWLSRGRKAQDLLDLIDTP